MECLLPYLSMVTVPHIMVGLERMLDYRGVGLERFHCICIPVDLFDVATNQDTCYCIHVVVNTTNTSNLAPYRKCPETCQVHPNQNTAQS